MKSPLTDSTANYETGGKENGCERIKSATEITKGIIIAGIQTEKNRCVFFQCNLESFVRVFGDQVIFLV